MSAHEGINKNQFIDVYHMSDSVDAPHTVAHPQSSGVANKTLFLGSGQTTQHFGRSNPGDPRKPRQFQHAYRVPMSALEPVVKGDDTFDGDHLSGYALNQLADASGVDQPELFESVGSSRWETVSRGKVQPYRNHGEGRGSLSFIMPKDKMEDLGIQYMGVKDGSTETLDHGKTFLEHPAKGL